MTERDLQRWSREVAGDPGAPSFVRLARAYRRSGRREAAREVVLGGLNVHPDHVAGHALLALIHMDAGERASARDEWETVLRLDPGNFDASRGLGFLALERDDLAAARRHLTAARERRPDDPTVVQALELLAEREAAAAADGRTGRPAERPFDPLFDDPYCLGALLLDAQGLVLAGRVEGGSRESERLGALLGAATAEAGRTAELLELGRWDAMLVETDEAVLHTTALEDGRTVVVVTEPQTPRGWIVRAAGRARELADRFLEETR